MKDVQINCSQLKQLYLSKTKRGLVPLFVLRILKGGINYGTKNNESSGFNKTLSL